MTTNRVILTKKNFFQGNKIPSMRDAYPRKDNRVEYQIYHSDYFSSADVKLYFGDIWVDDAVSISFQVSEEVMPIYGYHSYTYDAIARGRRLVQGQFAINFTSAGYLHQVIENAHAIFYALEEGKKKGLIQPQYYQNMKLNEILMKLGKESFDQIADEYEKAIWGVQEDNDQYLSYADRPFFRQNQLGFDIRIQYGAIAESTGYVNGRFYQSTKAEKPNSTVDVINGVQLNGMSKQIATSDQGAPILEYYSFIARDINGVSFAHLNRKRSQIQQVNDIPTVYRKMQYGPIV